MIRAAVDRLRADAEAEAAREAGLHALLRQGLDALEAGRFERVDDVRAWLSARRPSPA